MEYAKALSLGYGALDLIPNVMAENKSWRFLGI